MGCRQDGCIEWKWDNVKIIVTFLNTTDKVLKKRLYLQTAALLDKTEKEKLKFF